MKYVKEKYGFFAWPSRPQPQVTDGMFAPMKTGNYQVTMNHGGEKFGTLVNWAGLYPGYDNYQADEIAADLVADVVESTGHEPYDYRLVCDVNSYDPFDREYDNYFNTYYDGSNLYEVLSESRSSQINLVYINGEDVREFDLEPIAEKFRDGAAAAGYASIYVTLYSFESIEDFEACRDTVFGTEIFPIPKQAKREMPQLYDLQFMSYKKKKGGDERTYTTIDYSYIFDVEEDSYEYRGDYPEEKKFER